MITNSLRNTLIVTNDIAGAFKSLSDNLQTQVNSVFKNVMPAITIIIAIVFFAILVRTLIKNHREGGANWAGVICSAAALLLCGGAATYITYFT